MLINLIHHLLLCFDQSFASKDQCLIHIIKYIFDLSNLQMFAKTFILNDVKVETHMKVKVLVHEEEDQEND